MVNEEGQPEFSYQYLSPNLFAPKHKRSQTNGMENLKLWNCLPMMHANVGPT